MKIIIKKIVTWIVVSIVYAFSVEPLLKTFYPGFHNVELWIIYEITGLLIIFLIFIIITIFQFFKHR